MKAAFGMTPAEYKQFKGLERENLRDHMTNLELIFSMLGEAATTEIARKQDAQGFVGNKGAAPGGSSMQLFATILGHVCYRLHGSVVGPPWEGRVNPCLHLQDLFNRRLKRGQCFRTPCLGWSEFIFSYWEPFRDGITEVDTAFSLEITSMLLGMWNVPSGGVYQPKFAQDVKVVGGVLRMNENEHRPLRGIFREDCLGERWNVCYLKSKDGREVDFFLTKEEQPSLMIEVKWTDAERSPIERQQSWDCHPRSVPCRDSRGKGQRRVRPESSL